MKRLKIEGPARLPPAGTQLWTRFESNDPVGEVSVTAEPICAGYRTVNAIGNKTFRLRILITKDGTDKTVEPYLRLIAGFFLVLSLALGYWENPYWNRFTAFVGLNLFQSASTNWCPG